MDNGGTVSAERHAMAAIEPLLRHLGGKSRVDDHRVLSGILHRSCREPKPHNATVYTMRNIIERASTGSRTGAASLRDTIIRLQTFLPAYASPLRSPSGSNESTP